LGSARLIHWALLALVVVASGYLLAGTFTVELLPLPVHLFFIATIMFSMALLFGNMMSMAMEPMGHIAGSASSVINSLSTLIAIVFASLFGAQLQDNASPVAAAFLIMGIIAIALNWPNLHGEQIDETD
jgi:DHA1 family bicyclomycin/chloramphenicol resistance-like MFS transporter